MDQIPRMTADVERLRDSPLTQTNFDAALNLFEEFVDGRYISERNNLQKHEDDPARERTEKVLVSRRLQPANLDTLVYSVADLMETTSEQMEDLVDSVVSARASKYSAETLTDAYKICARYTQIIEKGRAKHSRALSDVVRPELETYVQFQTELLQRVGEYNYIVEDYVQGSLNTEALTRVLGNVKGLTERVNALPKKYRSAKVKKAVKRTKPASRFKPLEQELEKLLKDPSYYSEITQTEIELEQARLQCEIYKSYLADEPTLDERYIENLEAVRTETLPSFSADESIYLEEKVRAYKDTVAQVKQLKHAREMDVTILKREKVKQEKEAAEKQKRIEREKERQKELERARISAERDVQVAKENSKNRSERVDAAEKNIGDVKNQVNVLRKDYFEGHLKHEQEIASERKERERSVAGLTEEVEEMRRQQEDIGARVSAVEEQARQYSANSVTTQYAQPRKRAVWPVEKAQEVDRSKYTGTKFRTVVAREEPPTYKMFKLQRILTAAEDDNLIDLENRFHAVEDYVNRMGAVGDLERQYLQTVNDAIRSDLKDGNLAYKIDVGALERSTVSVVLEKLEKKLQKKVAA